MADWQKQIIPIDSLPPDDPVRRQRDEARREFEERAEYIRHPGDQGVRSAGISDPPRERAMEQAERYSARPTDVKLPDPSGSIRGQNYCVHCGRSMRLPQPGERPLAARFTAQDVTVEIYDRGDSSGTLMALIQVLFESLRDGKR